jgi:hypothetical protein
MLEPAAGSVVGDQLSVCEIKSSVHDAGATGVHVFLRHGASSDNMALLCAEGAPVGSCCFAEECCCFV